MENWLIFLLAAAALAGAAGLVWVRRNLLVVSVVGDSMAPAYRSGDQVLVRRVNAGRVRAGDVVVADTSLITDEHLRRMAERRFGPATGAAVPATAIEWQSDVTAGAVFKGGHMIKRVAAAPGDPLPTSVPPSREGESLVPRGRFVLLGDNPPGSLDSRYFGYVPATHLIGKVVRTIS